MKKSPANARPYPWHLYYEASRPAIRRRIVLPDGTHKMERLAARMYKQWRNNKTELESLVRRLNAEQFKEKISLEKMLDRNAFLSVKTIERYHSHLTIHGTSEEKVEREMSLLTNYVINVFVGKFSLPNPKDWHAEANRWYGHLLGPEAPKSAYTKKYIVQVMNKFMRWLHKERPAEIPLVVFDGFSATKLQSIERDRSVAGEKKRRTFIPESDWKKIQLALPPDIKPWAMLCYHYGLRRSESLGLLYEGTDCIYEDGIELKRQLATCDKQGTPKFARLKSQGRASLTEGSGRESRFIPHWLGIDPQLTFDWIEAGKSHVMSPVTFTKKWRAAMRKLGMAYDIHELRHTWVTRALAQYNSRDVQLAAGHSNIETTMRYGHDHRELKKKKFAPRHTAGKKAG